MKTCPDAYSLVAFVGKDNEAGTEVAVKMLKHYATMEQLKSLLSELKVLNFIGCHVNIVNLLAACTSNLTKGELYVVVEYCCYGNLQQYLLKNRHNFVRNERKEQCSISKRYQIKAKLSDKINNRTNTNNDDDDDDDDDDDNNNNCPNTDTHCHKMPFDSEQKGNDHEPNTT